MQRRKLVLSLGALTALPGITWADDEDTTADLIVVGSGIAGLSAAVSAAQNGAAKILVLEKAPSIGGHSILSTGYLSAVTRTLKTELEYREEVAALAADMLRLGEGRNDPVLVQKLAEESGNAVEWLEQLGLVWTPQRFQTLAGLSPRSFIPSLVRAGYDYIVTLNKAATSLGIKIALNTRAVRLLMDSTTQRICGVRASVNGKERNFFAKAVILATGGYGGNVAMRKKYAPRLHENFTTTANPYNDNIDYATGDGIVMAEEVGAALTDMDCIQTLPFWGGRLTDYVGADIYLNRDGERFVNEASSWKRISEAIWALPNHECWVVTDSQSLKGASRSAKLIKNIVRQASSVSEMASGMGISEKVLQATLDRYNGFAQKGQDADFGKSMFTQTISVPPYYYGKEHLFVHYCCGGVPFNVKSEVLTRSGDAIAGLFAAGEVTGGLHGADRVGGCSITDCVVYGRNAGRSAAQYVRQT